MKAKVITPFEVVFQQIPDGIKHRTTFTTDDIVEVLHEIRGEWFVIFSRSKLESALVNIHNIEIMEEYHDNNN